MTGFSFRTQGKSAPSAHAVDVSRARMGLFAVLISDVAITLAAIYGVVHESGTGNNGAQIAAILSSAFTAIGTMTTAYFGIKAVANTAQAMHTTPAVTATTASKTTGLPRWLGFQDDQTTPPEGTGQASSDDDGL